MGRHRRAGGRGISYVTAARTSPPQQAAVCLASASRNGNTRPPQHPHRTRQCAVPKARRFALSTERGARLGTASAPALVAPHSQMCTTSALDKHNGAHLGCPGQPFLLGRLDRTPLTARYERKPYRSLCSWAGGADRVRERRAPPSSRAAAAPAASPRTPSPPAAPSPARLRAQPRRAAAQRAPFQQRAGSHHFRCPRSRLLQRRPGAAGAPPQARCRRARSGGGAAAARATATPRCPEPRIGSGRGREARATSLTF